jgi:hypothetical protein
MATPPDDPQARISEARENIAGSLAELAGEVQELTDLRAWVRREPWLFVGGAFIVGVLLSRRPRALSALLSKLVPAVGMAAAKPFLKDIGEQLGRQFMQRGNA